MCVGLAEIDLSLFQDMFSFLHHLCKNDIQPNLPIQAGQPHNSPSGAV